MLNTKRDATRIVIAACTNGIGHHELGGLALTSLSEKIIRKLKNFNIQDLKYPFKLLKKGISYFHIINKRNRELMVISQGITLEEIKSIFPEVKLYSNWEELLPELEQSYKTAPVKVVVYRCAPFLLPINLS